MRNVADPTLLEGLPGVENMPTGEDDEVSSGPPDASLEQQRLRILADYTRFQIGLYTAVSAGVIVLAVWSEFRAWKLIPVFILALAGLAVGVVAANLLEAREVSTFRNTRIKPNLPGTGRSTRLPLLRNYHRWKGWRAERWERLARTGFWLAVLTFVGMTFGGAYLPARSARTSPPPPVAAATPATPPATEDAEEAILPPARRPGRSARLIPPGPGEWRWEETRRKPRSAPGGARRAWSSTAIRRAGDLSAQAAGARWWNGPGSGRRSCTDGPLS